MSKDGQHAVWMARQLSEKMNISARSTIAYSAGVSWEAIAE